MSPALCVVHGIPDCSPLLNGCSGITDPWEVDGTIHACPRGDSGITTCCRRTPLELPHTDRMTVEPTWVTCNRSRA